MEKPASYRVESLDLLRGLVMVIMALDHTRDYFHHGFFFADPTNLTTTTPLLFFTRWITHFCAPVFVFLSGTSAFLSGSRKKSKRDLSFFLFTRGLWLILLEVTVITFGWNFDITFGLTFLQVIWAIGCSMIALSMLIYLPQKMLLVLGILIVAGHNAFDSIHFDGNSLEAIAWYVAHQSGKVNIGDSHIIFFAYPVLPWLGVMLLGYCFGGFYAEIGGIYESPLQNNRKKWLLILGTCLIILFVVLRYTNIYGDMYHWGSQKNVVYTLLSFLRTSKYPPSLLFLCMTLGPVLLFLVFAEKIKNKLSDMLVVIGRVPLFYYLIHIYLIHVLSMLGLLITGHNASDTILTPATFGADKYKNFGFGLWVVYLVWILVIAIMYPLCKKYYQYKSMHHDKWWLGYL